MDQKLMVHLEVECDGEKFRLEMPYNAKLGSAYNACHEFLQKVLEMSKNVADNAKAQEKPVESEVVG